MGGCERPGIAWKLQAIGEVHPSASEFDDGHPDFDELIVQCRPPISHPQIHNRQMNANSLKLGVRYVVRSQALRAGSLKPHNVVRVIHHAASVSVGVPDPYRGAVLSHALAHSPADAGALA